MAKKGQPKMNALAASKAAGDGVRHVLYPDMLPVFEVVITM